MDAAQLSSAINGDAKEILGYALVLAGVGTLSMALLELVKGVTKFRRIYNRWAVREWVAQRQRTLRGLSSEMAFWAAKRDVDGVLAELELLSAGGHDFADALYDQPIEKLMGQIQAAANVAMDFPKAYEKLYNFISGAEGEVSSQQISAETDPAKRAALDPHAWREGAEVVRSLRHQTLIATPGQAPAPPTPAQAKQVEQASEARARLTNLVTRKLDAFQVETQYFWERINQWSAMLIGALIFYFSIGSAQGHDVALLLLAVPAGIVAPFAKDLVSSLSSFGSGK